MISRRFAIAGILLAVGFIANGVLPRATSEDKPAIKVSVPPTATSPTPGRFQIASASGQLFLLDTATGKVWKHAPNGKTDEHFFDAKVKDDPLADWSTKIGPTYQGIPLSYWLVVLRDGDEEFQKKGVEAIGHIGPPARAAVPELVAMFIKVAGKGIWLDNSAELLAWAIARIDPRHDSLRAFLHHKEYKVRRNAAIMINVLGSTDPNYYPRQSSRDVLTWSQSAEETEEELEPQWQLPKDAEAIPVLIDMLQDQQVLDTKITYAEISLEYLWRFKEEAKVVVPAVKRMLADKNAPIRRAAVKALGKIGPAAKDAIPQLRVALKDPEAAVRAAAVEALGKFADRDSLPALKALMKDGHSDVRQSVVGAFGRLKEDVETTVPLLLDVLKTPPSKVKWTSIDGDRTELIDDLNQVAMIHEALKALKRLGPAAKAAVPELIKQATLPDNQFAIQAHRTLQKVSPEEAAKITPPKR